MAAIAQLIDKQPEGFSLQQDFYRDSEIYRRELDRLFLKSWLYAGHLSQIPETGDFFLYELGDESVIIIRSGENSVKALLNLCRHRGSRICMESSGRQKLLVCPYHGWTYQLDGALRGANYTPPDFDRSEYALGQVRLEVLHGMIFINFAERPASFDPIRRDLDECLRPYKLDKAKVAHRQSYPIRANWKLAVENYCECYHRTPAHPEYAEGHGRSLPDEQVAGLLEQVIARGEKLGLNGQCVDKSWLEVGVKTTWLNGRLRANFTAYKMTWGNIQIEVEDPTPLAFSLGIVNFPEAEVDGFEFDFAWRSIPSREKCSAPDLMCALIMPIPTQRYLADKGIRIAECKNSPSFYTDPKYHDIFN